MKAYEQLMEVIEWGKKLEVNIEDAVFLVDDDTCISKGFELFRQKFLYTMLHIEKEQYPVSLYHFLQQLKEPINEWGIFDLEELEESGVPTNLVILDDEIGISEEAEELLREAISSKELSTKIIRDVLVYCREKVDEGKEMQTVYTAFRLFLILHPISDEETIELYCLEHGFDAYIASALESCYEDIPSDCRFTCQACGWTLKEKTKGVYICLKKECRRKYNASSLGRYQLDEHVTKRVKEGIQFSTVIPGIRELELQKRLENKEVTVQLYPDLERKGDLFTSKEFGDSILAFSIDVKDYRSPKWLARTLIDDFQKGLIKSNVIAVPDEKANRRYLQYVNAQLAEHQIPCKVYSFKTIVNMFKNDNSLQVKVRSFFTRKETVNDAH
ncbi:hypothetical protein V7139_23590 [Neobacillus drentensis]|uniref:restriction endonuclease-related protein n=1 Tax=Neobacillus drentensis TaxID=220684 RepID=UPI0030035255